MTDPKFAEEAFLYEMDNHEYCINMTGDIDVLQCFGIPYDEHEGACLDDLGLDGAYLRARRRHMDKAHENGII